MTSYHASTTGPGVTTPPRAAALRGLGLACAASGVLSVAVAVVTLAAGTGQRPAVPSDPWSYPFSTTEQWAVSAVLAVTHLLTLASFVGVLLARPHGRSRTAAAGLAAAVAGYAGLAACELASGSIGAVSSDSATASAVSGAFAATSLLAAAGSVVAGAVVVRRCGLRSTGWSMVLWSGVLMVVLVTPANVVGDPVLRMVALTTWSLAFVPLGLALVRASGEPSH